MCCCGKPNAINLPPVSSSLKWDSHHSQLALFSFSRFWPASCVCLFISATCKRVPTHLPTTFVYWSSQPSLGIYEILETTNKEMAQELKCAKYLLQKHSRNEFTTWDNPKKSVPLFKRCYMAPRPWHIYHTQYLQWCSMNSSLFFACLSPLDIINLASCHPKNALASSSRDLGL